jgi:fluoride exporter
MIRYLCVFLGGGLGSLTRYLVNKAFVQLAPQANFVIGTFFINVSGSFLIGLLMTVLMERLRVSPLWQLLVVTGFLGGYTTFSSFEFDGYLATRAGRPMSALVYLLGSVVLGYLAVWLGVLLAAKRS